MNIGIATLEDADVRALLSIHQRRMYEASPPGTSFALDLGGLAGAEISLFEAREGSRLLGVVAIRHLDGAAGELKSMRVADSALGTGVGRALLDHAGAVGRERGYRKFRLETGTGPVFAAANALYARNGFVRRGAFGNYIGSAFNIFYEKVL